ncbi:MAG: hypothetical protein PWQ91_1035 [Eubacteriales bacterium]|nr:hypothetical protein [Eubacteriales bacterium]
MPGRPHLRQRDREFLNLIGRYGYITMEHAKAFFGTKHYHWHRIKRLEEDGYIIRDRKGFIRLGPYGRDLVGIEMGVRLSSPQQLARRLEQVEVDIYLRNLPVKWDWVPSFIVKKEDPSAYPNFCKFHGLLQNREAVYLVYLLASRPRKRTINQIKIELDRFNRSGYRKAIVFCKSPFVMELFGYSFLGLEELHLLPYPHGTKLLIFLLPGTVQELGRILFGEIVIGENPQADFTVTMDGRKTDIWFLGTNDVTKLNRLKSYLRINYAGITGVRRNAVLCLEQQRQRYEGQLPGVPVYTFNLDEIMAKLVG